MLIKSEPYAFDVIIDQDDDDKLSVLTCVSRQKQPFPCVQILIPFRETNDVRAELRMLNYYASCSVNQKSLEKGGGTVHMVKTALLYMIDTYPYIRYVDVEDNTFIDVPRNTEKPLITPRRLIQGKQGWYEEHLKAVPDGHTANLKTYFQKKQIREKIDALLGNDSENPLWWTPTQIKNVMNQLPLVKGIGDLTASNWVIHSNVIQDYRSRMPYQIDQTGGSQTRVRHLLKKGRSYKVVYHHIGRLT